MECKSCGHKLEVTEIYNDNRWVKDDKHCPNGCSQRVKVKNIDKILDKVMVETAPDSGVYKEWKTGDLI